MDAERREAAPNGGTSLPPSGDGAKRIADPVFFRVVRLAIRSREQNRFGVRVSGAQTDGTPSRTATRTLFLLNSPQGNAESYAASGPSPLRRIAPSSPTSSNRTLTSLLTPDSCIVTPYSVSAAAIVCFECVTTMNWVHFEKSCSTSMKR